MTSTEYYQKNKEKILAQTKLHYTKNKEPLLLYQKQYRQDNQKWIAEKQKKKRQKRILDAIEIRGGKCENCAGVFDVCVYDFHHVYPEDKSFTIAENTLVSEKRFFEEIDKCILLCANCHRLVHKKDKKE